MAHDRDSAEAGTRLATVSTLIVADDDRRGELFDSMHLVLAQTHGRHDLVLPQLTEVFVYRRA